MHTTLITLAALLAGPIVDDGPEPRHIPPVLEDLGKVNEVRLVYFVPADREPIDLYDKRIEVLMTLVADTYRRSLRIADHNASGRDFEPGERGLRVHLVRW